MNLVRAALWFIHWMSGTLLRFSSVARIPTLAPHFGAAAAGPFNQETQMVPIIGLDNSDILEAGTNNSHKGSILGGAGTFTATQPTRLVKAVAAELNIQDCK